jgi:hypothetical protein
MAKRGALTMAEATPRPWKLKYEDDGDEIYYGYDGAWEIIGPEGCYLSGCATDGAAAAARAKANAELIVRAVNAHEALVKACGEYLIDHDVAAISRAEGPRCFCDRCEATRAALTLAKG